MSHHDLKPLPADLDNNDSHRAQTQLEERRAALAGMDEPGLDDELELAFLNAVTVAQTVLFSLPEGSPTIEEVTANVPGLVVIANVGISYSVSVPATDNGLGTFQKLYTNLPDPAADDLDTLHAQTAEKLSAGVWSE